VLIRLGRRRAQLFITGFSVLASLALTAVSYRLFSGQPEDLAAFFLPALLIPAVVAPFASGWVLDVALALDVAHRQAAEQATQLEAVLATTTVGIAHMGPDDCVRTANATARGLLRPNERGQVHWKALFVDLAEHDALRVALDHGSELRSVRWRWHDGHHGTRIVRGHVAPLRATGGHASGSVVVFEDITELTLLEAHVARTQQLELAGRLSGGMAHDFNGLLAIISASAASLARTANGSETALQAIEEAAARGARLTRRLLAISRRDVHAPVVRPVGGLLQEVVELVRGAVKPGIRLVIEPLPAGIAAAIDRDALQLALINLVMNANDALGDSGGIRLSVGRHEADGRAWMRIGVHDDGPGMPPAVLARATEPFFSTKASHLGTGLGLPIVSDTVERHGGRLLIDSQVGRGTDVWLWLPLVPAAECAMPPSDEPPVRMATLSSLEVLLVDDEPDLRRATERVLRNQGHRVTSVESVAAALQCLAAAPVPDLIVSDIMMPGATGLDLLHTVRRQGVDTPVLLVSGFAVEQLERELAEGRRVAFLAKPWTMEELQTSIRALVSG
jgi:two-component system, cell cycle sensor histidine kinase and response regulator CckA